MEQLKRKDEKYILKQKNIYEKEINKTQKFISAYQKAYKKGDIDIFIDFLIEKEKKEEFVNSIFNAVWREPQNNEPGSLQEVAVKVGISELTSRFGENLGGKLVDLYLQEKISYLDIHQLLRINQKSKNDLLSEEEKESVRELQGEQICELLDIFTDDELKVGIHRTGGNVSGRQIKEQGLILTGHLSSGVADRDADLDRNISFYENPGIAISQICEGGAYKNYNKKENVDIVLIGIPKKTESKNEEQIIWDEDSQPRLNPRYVLGHVSVNSISNTINHIDVERINKIKTIDNSERENEVQRWLQSFKKCKDMATIKPQYHGIKEKFFKLLNELRWRAQNSKAKETGKAVKDDLSL